MKTILSILQIVTVLCALALAGCKQGEGSLLDLRTSPPGAAIEVDGQRASGESPMRLRLAPGDHLIVAAKEGFLETRATVHVKAAGTTALDLPLRPLNGLVLVESLPADADVLVDGAFRGKTPLLLTDLPGGQHRLTVKKEGYESKEAVHTVADRQPKLLSLELRSLLVAIKVTSEPDKAKVFLDGSFIGEAPQSLQNVLAGKHKVRLELDGYEPYEQEVQVAGKEEYRVHATLQEKYASIRLDTDPTGGEVYLNNESRGKAPVVLDKLHEGEFAIKVVKRGFPEVERKVTLKKGENLELRIPFEKLLGIVQVITIPPGVEVFVDGESKGTTQAVPNQQYSMPLFVREVPQGQRIVKFVKPGYAEVSTLVAVKVDQTTVLNNVQLKRLFIPDTEIVTKDGRTLRGLVNRTAADGTIHFETAPGIFQDIPQADIASKKAIAR
jgi:hypothetical protein